MWSSTIYSHVIWKRTLFNQSVPSLWGRKSLFLTVRGTAESNPPSLSHPLFSALLPCLPLFVISLIKYSQVFKLFIWDISLVFDHPQCPSLKHHTESKWSASELGCTVSQSEIRVKVEKRGKQPMQVRNWGTVKTVESMFHCVLF